MPIQEFIRTPPGYTLVQFGSEQLLEDFRTEVLTAYPNDTIYVLEHPELPAEMALVVIGTTFAVAFNRGDWFGQVDGNWRSFSDPQVTGLRGSELAPQTWPE